MPSAYSAFDVKLGARIRDAREAAGLELPAFADRLEVDRTTAGRIESGYIKVSAERLVEIAKIVRRPITELLPATARRRAA